MQMRLLSLIFALAFCCLPVTIGCSIFGGKSGVASSQPTQSQMILAATKAEKSYGTVMKGLNDAFDLGLLPATTHKALDPYVKACRSALNELSAAAERGDTNVWRLAYDSFIGSITPLLEAQVEASLRATAKKNNPTPP